jgi:glycosyltransferase involved in cell wall biosynthesis
LVRPVSPDVEAALSDPKVDARIVAPNDFSSFEDVDVAHRPFQPDATLDVAAWRASAARTLVTVLDLIAYHVGTYHESPRGWMAYRDVLRRATARVDGIVAPADDVARSIRAERLPVSADRLHVVPLGSDHLTGNETDQMPSELLARGLVTDEFLLVIGADYGHKNRDVAIKAVAELHRRGFRHQLVLVGAAVPYGSSRLAEARARSNDSEMIVLPDASRDERNWLLRHSKLVLYPTSAEGFGFVPYEAARFGTPTVLVPVGPLAGMKDALPVTALDWGPSAVADAAERLLVDPSLARAQVSATLVRAEGHTWAATAAQLVEVYRAVLSRPSIVASDENQSFLADAPSGSVTWLNDRRRSWRALARWPR